MRSRLCWLLSEQWERVETPEFFQLARAAIWCCAEGAVGGQVARRPRELPAIDAAAAAGLGWGLQEWPAYPGFDPSRRGQSGVDRS